MTLKWKICGMRDPQNIGEVLTLQPDWMGFIFYPPSPRFVVDPAVIGQIDFPATTLKTGVFVNENESVILETARLARLDAIQLHGKESPALCASLRAHGFQVLKAISTATSVDLRATNDYLEAVDYFVFDTATAGHGGSGKQFDWQVLENYTASTPFLLSGGVGPTDAARIASLQHPALAGIDLNSRFESAPGFKNFALLKEFIQNLSRL